jgi:glucokinase
MRRTRVCVRRRGPTDDHRRAADSSGRALLHEARDIAGAQRERGRRLLELGGGTLEGIESVEVTQAAREGDPAALECFEVVGGWLGQGMADLAAVLDPEVFLLGGGVSDAGELLLAPARAAFRARLTGGGARPEADVRLAELGNDAGIVGAADLARTR